MMQRRLSTLYLILIDVDDSGQSILNKKRVESWPNVLLAVKVKPKICLY